MSPDVQRDAITEVVTAVALRLAAATDDELDAVIDDALGAIATVEDADRAYVTLYEPNGRFSNTHEWVAEGVAPHRGAIVGLAQDDFGWSIALARTPAVWHCPNLDDLPPEADAERRSFAAFGVHSVLQVPLCTASGTLGVVGFNHQREPRTWSPLAIDLVRRVGESIGYALLRRQITLDLRAARDAAEDANRAKDRFLSHVSHELRTPLHAILGFAELLDTPALSTGDRTKVRQIISSGRELQALVDSLLASSEGQTPIE